MYFVSLADASDISIARFLLFRRCSKTLGAMKVPFLFINPLITIGVYIESTRQALSQFLSFKIPRTTLLTYKKFVDPRILRL